MRKLGRLCLLLCLAAVIILAATANDHRIWMDEMEILSVDLTDAFGSNDAPKVAAAIDKMVEYQVRTEEYWTANRQDDIVKLAQDSLALSRAISAAAKMGNMEEAESKFGELSANCTACHDRRPERRLPVPQP